MGGIYDKLPPGDYVRLLQVHSSIWSQNFTCSFRVASLKDCKGQYEAISYAWGDTTPVSHIEFSHSQQLLPLSQTLFDLFLSLRKKSRKFTVWIDALCINQADKHERASQVLLMGTLYTSARQVLVWLGAGTSETHSAFRLMRSRRCWSWLRGKIDEQKLKEDEMNGLVAVFRLLARPWFQRAWVVQEASLNPHLVVVCGQDWVNFEFFRVSIFAIWRHCGGLIGEDEEDPAQLGLSAISRLINVRNSYHVSGPVRYEILLELAFLLRATDVRDKVYAFRGLADDLRPVPKPAYTADVTPERLFRETAEALLCHGTSLDLLALCGIARQEDPSQLPSWVPDLGYRQFGEPFVGCDGGDWDFGGPLLVPPEVVSEGKLQVQASYYGVVDITCPPFTSSSVMEQKEAFEAILALRSRIPFEMSHKRWLGYLYEAMIFNLDIDDQPVGTDYVADFLSWIEWLQSSTSEDDLARVVNNKYHLTMGARVDEWKAFMTKGGTALCIGPPDIEVGDEVYFVPGCRFPLVMRSGCRNSVSHGTKDKILVSWCFLEQVSIDNKPQDIVPPDTIWIN